MGRLYWSIRALPFADTPEAPSEESIGRLRSYLDRAFPSADNQSYLDALMGPLHRRPPQGVTVARLTALSLLPPLLVQAGLDPSHLRLARNEHGRPYGEWVSGAGTAMDFNLSHSDRHAVCALLTGGGRVGVDAEEALPPARALPLIRRFCTEGEHASLRGLSEEASAAAFTRIWTIREALSKQDGRGMPLRYDAAHIPDGLQVLCGRIPSVGTRVALCVPDSLSAADVIPVAPTLPIEWE